MTFVCFHCGWGAILSVISSPCCWSYCIKGRGVGESLLGFGSLDSHRVLQDCFPRQLPAEPAQHAVTKDLNITPPGRGCRKGRIRKFVRSREIFEWAPIDEIWKSQMGRASCLLSWSNINRLGLWPPSTDRQRLAAQVRASFFTSSNFIFP